MAIEEATQAQVQTGRDEVYKLAQMLQKWVQGEPDQAGTLTAVNAQVTATKAAVDAINAASAG